MSVQGVPPDSVDLSNPTGTLPATNGGTGLTTSGSDSSKALKSDGNGGFTMGSVGAGSVTSVSGPSIISWANATTTPTGTLVSQASGTLFGVPGSATAAPTFFSAGTADQVVSVNHTGNGIEGKTITSGSGITITPTAGVITVTNAGVISVNSSTGAITNVAKTDAANSWSTAQTPNAAGTIDLGSTALPFRNVILGGAATNNTKLVSATTAAQRTVTFPDADSNTIIPDTGAANNFLTAVSSLGVISKAQPAFTDISGTATAAQLPTNQKLTTLTFVIDGGGSTITTGVKGDLISDFAGTIQSATVLADQSGSIVIDVWKRAYALDTPPTVSNTITASALPTLASHQSSQDTTLTGWTTSITAGDVIRFNVNSATTVTRVSISLKVLKT